MRATSHRHRFAKALRRSLSPPEVLLWVRLRTRQNGRPVFRRQHPIGVYVADFYCASAKLVVEIDGLDHAAAERLDRDAMRDQILESTGHQVMRIAASEVLTNPDGVAEWVVSRARELGGGD